MRKLRPWQQQALVKALRWLQEDRQDRRFLINAAPGAGKTALAEHIARTLDKPLMVKRASDLMSKFVGETEQQMAAMFREAEAEKAVLLLD